MKFGECNRIYTREWLILTDKDSITILEKKGYLFTAQTKLNGLGGIIATVITPDSHDITQAQSDSLNILEKQSVSIDFNHIYSTEQSTSDLPKKEIRKKLTGVYPKNIFQIPDLPTNYPATIGIIDTAINKAHDSLQDVSITTEDFAPENFIKPDDHGTAIASILSGSSKTYSGLLPRKPLFAASVFFNHPQEGRMATTSSLILSLNWLILSNVDVINMSLSGPPNKLLEKALRQVHQQGVVVVAAVGNSGPTAEPLYPAAYPFVTAVTAVSKNHTVYRKAVRGKHVDLAAPGVNIIHAELNGLTVSSGTSLATPFVTANIIYGKSLTGEHVMDIIEKMYQSAVDLGESGVDPIYGHGLIQPIHKIIEK